MILLKMSVPPDDAPLTSARPIPKPYNTAPNIVARNMSLVSGGRFEAKSISTDKTAVQIKVLIVKSLPIILNPIARSTAFITPYDIPTGIPIKWYSIVDIPDTPPLTILFGKKQLPVAYATITSPKKISRHCLTVFNLIPPKETICR